MLTVTSKFKLRLLGPFSLMDPEGRRIAIPSRKGAALIAMLAVSKDGERARGWLQTQLWGSREPKEANGSLRRELSDLRRRLNQQSWAPLVCERDRVRLDLGIVSIDVLEPDEEALEAGLPGEFLEGLDIPGEDAFEDWLREQRSRLARSEAGHARGETAPKLSEAVAVAQPGFKWSTQSTNDGPSLAVLRFSNLTGDPEEAYFAEGFKQELINRLSRVRWLAVVAGDSGGPRALAITAQEARSLGAKYLLDGTVRTASDLTLIDVTLYEAARLQVVWSKRLQIARSVIATALDECLQELVAHLGAKIDHGEQSSARDRLPSGANVTDLIWRGRWHLYRLQHADSDEAQELFAKALALDPHSPEALINVTHGLAWSIWTGRQPAHRVLQMRRLAQQSMRADPSDGRAYWLAGTAETWLRHMQPALDLLFQAVELTPSLAIAHAQIGSTLNLAGRPEQAGEPLQLARRLSPFDVHLFFVLGELAMRSSLLGDYREAISYADLAIVRREQYWYAHMVKIDALLKLRERQQAVAAFEELRSLKPHFSSTYIDWIPFEDRALNRRFAESVDQVAAGHARPATRGSNLRR
jgi:TolB-like protein/Flp pilus assembly protein TadD